MEPRSTGPTRGTERRWWRWLAFSLASSLGLGLVAALATLVFGRISGEEFCPDSFTRRSFTYFEIPLLGWQVSPISHADVTNDLETRLTTEKYILAGSPPKNPPSWHLVVSRRSGVITFQGDAAILCKYLDARDAQGLYWQEWTVKHPDLARTLWPLVAKIAAERLYLFVPDLFDLTSQATTPAALDAGLRAALARNYARLAEIQQGLGQPDAADEFWDQALLYAPDQAEFRRRRAASGRPEAAGATSSEDAHRS